MGNASNAAVALVTGAGSGIGKAVALGLARAGYRVVITGRREGALNEVAAEAAPGTVTVLAADVTDETSVAGLFADIEASFGRLDVLFNNAGTNAPGVPIDELPADAWRRVIDTNLTGAFLCTQAAFGLMKRQTPRGGRIINNGSISSTTPRPNSAPYTASKHAITGLTKSTSLDGRIHGIACGQIDIGNAATAMTAKMASGVLQADMTIKPEPTVDLGHVVAGVLYMASLPLEANVLSMTIMATTMPLVGRG